MILVYWTAKGAKFQFIGISLDGLKSLDDLVDHAESAAHCAGHPWAQDTSLAVALVTDIGGSLCHAAVVAREYRLPAVVGTHVATKQIKNGQLIEVDGTSGVIRLL